LVLYVTLLILAILILQGAVAVVDPAALRELTVWGAAAACAAAWLASWVMMSSVESRPPASLGLVVNARAARDGAAGFVFGFAVVSVVPLAMAAAGWLQLSGRIPATATVLWSTLYVTILLAVAALFEEIAVRGYAFQVLARARGPAVAIVSTALVFAGLHAANPGVGWTAIGNTLLAGILLGILYWRTLSLWWVTGTHFAWNWTMGVAVGLPVSGLDVGAPVVGVTAGGPGLLTGGDYGPEAGLLLTLATLCGIVWAVRTPRLSRDPEVLALGPMVETTTHG
jgi:membrane protease YdiL (CAAX protease family)